MRWPSGAHEMGLATLATNNLGVPPETARARSPMRSTRLTNEVDRCAIGRKRGAEERHASLRWDNPHVVRGRRLTYPQAGVVAIALHVGDVSPVRRDRRPLRIAARCQLRDLEVGERLLARRRLRVWPQQPVESGRSDEEQHGSGRRMRASGV